MRRGLFAASHIIPRVFLGGLVAILESKVKGNEAFERRADHWRREVERLREEEDRIRLGGGLRAQDKQGAQGKMTARERVEALCDPGAPFLELGLWVADGFYREYGGAPAAGVVVGICTIHGRDVVVVANDATVKAGAWFPLTCKKVLRAQEIALENRLPIVYLVDSAGVFLPLQDEIFPDREHFGRAFYNNARLSAAGVYQLAAIMGSCVAGVANQRSIVERKTGTRAGDKELQIGGVIYSESADKGARFVELCNQKQIPLLFLQDVTGFMVGSRAERGGIIKDGAKMVNAVANSTVPKITLFVGNSYGAGNYAMCGKAYGPRFLYAWPSAAIAVMGGDQASQTLLSIQLKNRGADVSEEAKAQRLAEIKARYAAAMDPRYAAARLWVDGLIDPAGTGQVLATSPACP